MGEEQQQHRRQDPVSKILRLPWSTRDFIDRVVTGSVNESGRQTLYMLITTWDMAGGGPFAAGAVASTGMAKTVDIVEKSLNRSTRWTSTLSSTRWLRRCSGISPASSPDATDKRTQGVNSAFTGEN